MPRSQPVPKSRFMQQLEEEAEGEEEEPERGSTSALEPVGGAASGKLG